MKQLLPGKGRAGLELGVSKWVQTRACLPHLSSSPCGLIRFPYRWISYPPLVRVLPWVQPASSSGVTQGSPPAT